MINQSAAFLFAFTTLLPFATDQSRMAIFDLKKNPDGTFHLKAVFNRRNLLNVLQDRHNTLHTDSLSMPLKAYLGEHLAFYFDDEPVEMEWHSARTGEQFISIEAHLHTEVSSPYNIRIQNSCLVDKVAQHANLIRIYLYEGKRIFRLDANRKTTMVRYQVYESR